LIEHYPKGSYATEARYWLACSLLALDKDNEAMDQYQKVIHDSPDSLWAPKAYMGLGNGYLKKRDYEQAEKQYLKILDLYHFYDELNLTYFKLGQTYELGKKPQQAHAAYRTLLEKYPKSLEVTEAMERMKALEDRTQGLQPVAEASPGTVPATPTLVVVPTMATVTPIATILPAETDETVLDKPFHVQIGVYTRPINVEKAQKAVKKAGYSSFVVKAKEKDIPYTYYKVRVGAFADKKSAEKLAKILAKKTKEKAIVVED
jgi:tetratricopeptide (TPR) repeat protein